MTSIDNTISKDNVYSLGTKELKSEKSYKNYPNKDEIKVATMTLISKINCNINIKKIVENVKLEDGKIEKIKFGNKKKDDVEEIKIVPDDSKKKVRKNKKKKKNFYNQVTIIIKPFITRKNGVNMKLSENGSIQMTGTTSIEEGHLTIKKMIELLYEWNTEIFYRKIKENTDDLGSEGSSTTGNISIPDSEKIIITKEIILDTIQNKTSLENPDIIQILFMKCELIIVSFEIPFLIHLKKFDEILKTKYNLLSILGTSSYPGINTKITYDLDCNETEHIKKKKKYSCNCRDMSIFTFRTGKVIITGFENLDKIKIIFDKYISIVKAEEDIIKVENCILEKNTSKDKEKSPKITPVLTTKKTKIMKVNNKVFEIVEEF